MKRPEIDRVEVDMVPLIDIVSLLLMFLIVVGDAEAGTTAVKMKLPAAGAGRKLEPEPGMLTIEIGKNVDGRNEAVVNRRHYRLDGELKRYLDGQLAAWEQMGAARRIRRDGADVWNTPVRLRIPESCPMADVGAVVGTLQDLKLLDVRYAAQPLAAKN